jgi:hypothetical protein
MRESTERGRVLKNTGVLVRDERALLERGCPHRDNAATLV